MKQRTPRKLQNIVSAVAGSYKPERILMFGSRVWGKPNIDSDFDLFIIKNTREGRYRRQVRVRRFIHGALPVDILVYTPREIDEQVRLGDHFIRDVLAKGHVLYEAAPE